MKSKISLFKSGLIKSDLKRFWWISVIYSLALIFLVPIYHYMSRASYNDRNLDLTYIRERIGRELLFQEGSSQILLLVIPVLIGVLIFRYIQKGKSASLYHSLPLTRTSLYVNSLISGTILLLVPIIITSVIMFLLNGFSILSDCYSAGLIIGWGLYTILFGFMFLAMTAFVGMFTGNSITQAVFVYILNVLPIFILEFIRLHLALLLFGFDNFRSYSLEMKLPMVIIFNSRPFSYSPGLIVGYVILTLTLLVGGWFAFKLRRPETAGDIITFRPVKPLFIYGFTVCGTLLGSAYFSVIGNNSVSFVIFGYFICSLVAFVIVQMLTNKSFKILHTWKSYLGVVLVLTALLLGVKFDIFGYENKIPAASEITEAYVGSNINFWTQKDKEGYDAVRWGDYDTGVYKNPANIENIRKLHKLILDTRSKTTNGSQYIAYKLKDGTSIVRFYPVDFDLYSSAFGPIYESDEYKQSRYPILHQTTDDIKYVEVKDDRAQNSRGFVISDKKQLQSFKDAITKDIQELSYSTIISQPGQTISINIGRADNKPSTTYQLRPDYKNTFAWLKKEGIYDKVILKADDVSSVVLEKYSKFDYPKAAETVKRTTITNKALIQELLDLSLGVDYRNKTLDFNIVFYKDENNPLFGTTLCTDQKVSQNLQNYIDQLK